MFEKLISSNDNIPLLIQVKNLQYIMGHESIAITLDLYANAEAGADRDEV